MNNHEQTLMQFALEIKSIKGDPKQNGSHQGKVIKSRTSAHIKSTVTMLSGDYGRLPKVSAKKTRRARVSAKQAELNRVFSELLKLASDISSKLESGISADHTLEQAQATIIDILGQHFCQHTAQLYSDLGEMLSRNAHELRDLLGCPELDR